MIQKDITIKLVCFIVLIFLLSFCSNNKNLKGTETQKKNRINVLEKKKQFQQDSLESLKREISQLKKKKDSIANKNKGILEKKQ